MTMNAKTKLMEWLALSDTISLTFNDNIRARPWFFGDTSAYFGDTSLYFFGDADQTARGVTRSARGWATASRTASFVMAWNSAR